MKNNNKILYCIEFILLFILTNYGYKFIVKSFHLTNYLNKDILELLVTLIDILILSLLLKNVLKEDLKIFIPNFKKNFKKIWFIYILMGIIESTSIFILSDLFENASVNQQAVENSSLWLSLLVGVILAPLSEELLYRCLLKKIITNNYVFVILSGIIFAFVHVSGEASITNMLLFSIPYFIGGLFLAIMYCKTDNIFMTYLAHLLHNFI